MENISFLAVLFVGILLGRILSRNGQAEERLNEINKELAELRAKNLGLESKCKFFEGVDIIPLDGDFIKISDGEKEVVFNPDGKISRVGNLS